MTQSNPADASTDVLIVGGGLGGVAAALAAAAAETRVILTEESDWLGGQLTSQGVPPDEHQWIDRVGSRSYRHLRSGIRHFYRDWYPLRAAVRRQPYLNPGAGSVSPLCHEPAVARAVIEGMLAQYASRGLLRVWLSTKPIRVDVDGDRIRGVSFLSLKTAREVTVQAKYVLDATETGDLLPMAGVEYATGAEAQSQTDEPHATSVAQPLNMQAASMCFVLDHIAGRDFTIDEPESFDYWSKFRASFWPNEQLSWTAPNPRTLEPTSYTFEPNPKEDPVIGVAHAPHLLRGSPLPVNNLWLYRRILARENFETSSYESDLIVVNWPMNDYFNGPLFEVDKSAVERNLESARQLSLSLLYWLQTAAPRPDGGAGWPGLRLRTDVFDTEDGLAKQPYVRESRRIHARYTVCEQDVSRASRGARGVQRYRDSVGVGYYRIDLHPSTGGDNFIDIDTCPFEIPLGALVPIRVRNLLPSAKNIGTTHITSGCYRLHPVEWSVGEAAGLLSAFCVMHSVSPEEVHGDDDQLAAFRASLRARGVDLHWPNVIAKTFSA